MSLLYVEKHCCSSNGNLQTNTKEDIQLDVLHMVGVELVS